MEHKEKEIEELWSYFFKKPRNNYNPYMLRLLDFPDYILFKKKMMNDYKGKWKEFFKNENPIYLEIGTGSGNFTKEIAKRHPERNFIGLELRFKRLCLAASKCQKESLNNVVFLRRRGEELSEFLGKEELSGLYINFPDPWEGNEKNRMIQEKLFSFLDSILKVGGVLFFKTDHDQYYQDVLALVRSLEHYQVIYHTSDLHQSEKAENNIKTEFEHLFLYKHNKNINYIEIQKVK